MNCTFVIYNEDRKTVLAASDGYRHSPPTATQRTGESPVNCAKRGYKEMFGSDLPNHLISLNERDVVHAEGLTVYCVTVKDNTAARLPSKWVSVDKALSPMNPHASLFQLSFDRGRSATLLQADDRTVVLPDILAALPYSESTVNIYREYAEATTLEAKLYFRMYRGYLETLREILGRSADVRKEDKHIWNEEGFRIIGTERGVSLECSLTVNPYVLVEQYRGFLQNLHSKMDAIGIASV